MVLIQSSVGKVGEEIDGLSGKLWIAFWILLVVAVLVIFIYHRFFRKR